MDKDLISLDISKKLNPLYQRGHELGSKGQEPPMDLNRVTRPKVEMRGKLFDYLDYSITDILFEEGHRPKVKTEVDPAKASFRQGYLDGLKQFMEARGIDVFSTGLFSGTGIGTGIITTDDGLTGFVRGARLEAPSIPRNYHPSQEEGILERYLERNELDFVKEMRFKDATTQAGYILGFVVGVAREHGVILKGGQVPMDNASYQAFTQGLNGEERALPLEPRLLCSLIEKNLIKEESPLSAEIRAHDWSDNQAYHAGLQIWLKLQGVEGVGTWQIRHPEALRAFKAALSG